MCVFLEGKRKRQTHEIDGRAENGDWEHGGEYLGVPVGMRRSAHSRVDS